MAGESQYPRLQVQPGSGLTFSWAEYLPQGADSSGSSFGHGPMAETMIILVYWHEMVDKTIGMLGQLIGYSYRNDGLAVTRLSRVLPWKHPLYSQLWCTRITAVQGMQLKGKNTTAASAYTGGAGPISSYKVVALHLQFTRPNYPVLPDSSVPLTDGFYPEYLRFTDRYWRAHVQMLSREGQTFAYREGTPSGNPFPGTVGTKVCHVKLTRTWYQIPEQCVLDGDGFPSGVILKPSSGDAIVASVNDDDFFGCPAGTLLYETPEIIPQELPLPQILMNLGFGEQFPVQYDVKFNFDYFNPPLGTGTSGDFRGHNCMPWAGDARWYIATINNSRLYNGFVSAVGNTTPIRITSTAPNGFATGDIVQVAGTGTAAANGTFFVTVIDTTHFDLVGTVASGASGTAGTFRGGPTAFPYMDFRNLWQVL